MTASVQRLMALGVAAALAEELVRQFGGTGNLVADNNLSDLTNIPTARTNLGLGTLATKSAVAVANSSTATLTGDGVTAPLTAAAKVSGAADNALIADGSGLYVPASTSGVPEAPTDGQAYGRGNSAWEALAAVSTSGSYNDLSDKPSQTFPAAGIPVSTGTAWDASKPAPAGDLVGATDTQTLINKTLGAGSVESVTTASTITINAASAPFQQITLTANATATVNLAVGVSRTIWINPGTYTVTWPAGTVLVGLTSLPASKWSLITLTGMPSNTAGVAALVASQS